MPMNFTEEQIVAYTRFLQDNHITFAQSSGNEWRVNTTANLPGVDTTRGYPTYREAVLAIAKAASGLKVAA